MKRSGEELQGHHLRKALTLSTSSEIPSSTSFCLRGQENFEILFWNGKIKEMSPVPIETWFHRLDHYFVFICFYGLFENSTMVW